MIIYVIGFIGSDRAGVARKISEEKGLPCYDLAKEIEKREGQSVQRLVMTMGEHELRNKEYETLVALLGELGETATPETVDEDMPMICSRCAHEDGIAAVQTCSAEEGSLTVAAGGAEEDSATVAAVTGNLSEKFRGSDETVAVICCNDGVILDPMSCDIIRAGEVVLADDDTEAMWERAKDLVDTPYAFLLGKDEAAKKAKYLDLYERRRPLYEALAK